MRVRGACEKESGEEGEGERGERVERTGKSSPALL